MGKMDEGFYRGVEPVAVVSASNTEEVRQALRATIARAISTSISVCCASCLAVAFFFSNSDSWPEAEGQGPWHILSGYDLEFAGMSTRERVRVMLEWFGRRQTIALPINSVVGCLIATILLMILSENNVRTRRHEQAAAIWSPSA